MTHFKEIETTNKYNTLFVYSGISSEELAIKVDELLTNQGYKLESGSMGDGVYFKGDKTMRILFGAFVKYFKIRFVVAKRADNNCSLDMRDATPELSGGLMGIRQAKKEMERLTQVMQSL
ncbi:hypothetical protein [Ulvibacter antarcticus]|uniref:Uncharacterized protein n=1 Tax=Ulvibacter antarcticus TaxID=442714 RepID=A0A3L9YKG9_9FLAO|nr:hypothetical protein [Ulvibacter antarcticus]RMA58625.1 hypothetical protein BXY75_1999 [Ulvibacter antarcticus]